MGARKARSRAFIEAEGKAPHGARKGSTETITEMPCTNFDFKIQFEVKKLDPREIIRFRLGLWSTTSSSDRADPLAIEIVANIAGTDDNPIRHVSGEP